MKKRNRCQSICRSDIFIPLFMFILFAATLSSAANLPELIKAVSEGPQIYYSAAAYSYYTRKGTALPAQQLKDKAEKSFKAALQLASIGPAAHPALAKLIEQFPKAVHITEIRNVHYSGEGTFEDWVQTYVTGEKNKFLLSAPFLSYEELSLCEQFITSTHIVERVNGERVTIPTKDLVSITVTHTVYFGAYALSKITGKAFGTDETQWRNWWNTEGTTFKPVVEPTAANTSIRLRSGQAFNEIQLYGKYRMYLTTGDNLVGRVEAKDDTSLILETEDHKAYTFRPLLITKFDFLEPPKKPVAKKGGAIDSLPFSFDELRGKNVGTRPIEVRINSGMVFRGTLQEITADGMKLKVGASSIPISRDVVLNVRIVPPAATPKKKVKKTVVKKGANLDTVIVKSLESDDWGVPKPDITLVGNIDQEFSDYIIITTTDGMNKKIQRAHIVRVIKKTRESYQEIIARYAKPLFCPQDMFLVDMPPGKEGRPFFKVCVDRYEYPNLKDAMPKVNVSYDDARTLCSKRGKRLCSADEWQYACSGLEGYTYPYGWNPEKHKCNTDPEKPEASGARHNCVSKYGGYDMAGNVFEWVTGKNRQPALMGGPKSKCQTKTEGVSGEAKPGMGFRCCKSN